MLAGGVTALLVLLDIPASASTTELDCLMHAGSDGFELEMGPWSVLGNKALSTKGYKPDFSAVRTL